MDEKKIEVKVNDDEIEVNVGKNLESPQSSDVSLEKKSVFKVIGNWMLIHILKPLWKYLKGIAFDLRRDISENPNIIWFILVALPGIFIGLFLTQHINASKALTAEYSQAGIEIFIMELAGCLNIVWGFSIMKKRNLKSSIYATITTAIIVVCGVLWISNFYLSGRVWINDNKFRGDAVVSMICVIISMVSPVIGTVCSFFTRNKNYKKETL